MAYSATRSREWNSGKMRFNMLGTLEVIADSGEKVRIPRPRLRELLAVLLLMNRQPASTETLIGAIWGDDAPNSKVGTLRTHVYLLRRNPAVAERLQREDGGYRLDVRPGELDLADFRTLAAQGQSSLETGDLHNAEKLLRQAISLWRLPKLRDLPDTPPVMEEVVKLYGERARANEQLIEAMLRQGRYREIVPELKASVFANPLNERAWEQLIVALYRLGRRAEAIQTYNDVRTLLVDEYGIDPSTRLRYLFQQLLRDDPALARHFPEPPQRT